jgi:hypothetical protein
MNEITIAITTLRKIVEDSGNLDNLKPSEVVKKLWAVYEKNYESNNNINGSVFEEVLGFVLAKEGCVPFYMQARVAYVPNVNYDFILYDDSLGPISLSAKTSLRERWKQADLEAVALKYVHRNALSYALTLNEQEAKTRISKLKECMALNDFILADSQRFDELIEQVKERKLEIAGKVDIVTSNTVIDRDAAHVRYGL